MPGANDAAQAKTLPVAGDWAVPGKSAVMCSCPRLESRVESCHKRCRGASLWQTDATDDIATVWLRMEDGRVSDPNEM
ncbi:MAG: hypothetical protein ACYSUI_07535 [Planctomycetota bacterium]|jgi:hypothetical protein